MLTNWGSEDRKVTVYLPAWGVKLDWVSRVVPEEGERIVTVRAWLAGITASPSKEDRVIVLGYLVATALLTVMVTEARVERFPALSTAWAVRVWLALVKVVVSRVLLAEAEEEVANTEPSTLRVMVLRPELTWPVTVGSEAVAEKVMLPLTVPVEGEVMETVGGVVSGLGLTVIVVWAVTEPWALVAVRV
jgi:hypothetical protein